MALFPFPLIPQFKKIEMEIFRNDKLIGINNFYFSVSIY